MKKDAVMRKTARALENAGYSTVVVRNIHTCIDIFASKLNRTIAVKAAYNIDSVSKDEATAMLRVSRMLGAEAVVVGENSQNGMLSEGVVYRRFSADCISTGTFPTLEENRISKLAAKSAGVKVRIDTSRLRHLMRINRLSTGRLAESAGVASETVYKYVRGEAYASLRVATKLERVLNGSITAGCGRANERNGGEVEASRFGNTDMLLINVGEAPFSGMMKRRNTYEISYDANPRTMEKRARLFGQLHELLDSNYPFFVSRKRNGRVHGIPVISESQVMGIGREEELVDLLSM